MTSRFLQTNVHDTEEKRKRREIIEKRVQMEMLSREDAKHAREQHLKDEKAKFAARMKLEKQQQGGNKKKSSHITPPPSATLLRLGFHMTILPSHGRRGLLINAVIENSPAYRAGIITGDIIKQVNSRLIHTRMDYDESLRGISTGATIPITIWRDGATLMRAIHVVGQAMDVDVIEESSVEMKRSTPRVSQRIASPKTSPSTSHRSVTKPKRESNPKSRTRPATAQPSHPRASSHKSSPPKKTSTHARPRSASVKRPNSASPHVVPKSEPIVITSRTSSVIYHGPITATTKATVPTTTTTTITTPTKTTETNETPESINLTGSQVDVPIDASAAASMPPRDPAPAPQSNFIPRASHDTPVVVSPVVEPVPEAATPIASLSTTQISARSNEAGQPNMHNPTQTPTPVQPQTQLIPPAEVTQTIQAVEIAQTTPAAQPNTVQAQAVAPSRVEPPIAPTSSISTPPTLDTPSSPSSSSSSPAPSGSGSPSRRSTTPIIIVPRGRLAAKHAERTAEQERQRQLQQLMEAKKGE